jgi:hypothetical protein
VTSGGTVGLDDVAGPRGLLVMFICAHCPYVIHVQDELARVGRDYAARGIGTVAISSNDAEAYPADAPERLAEQARTVGFSFPYLHDASQEVARAYDAACTPDLFLFDAARRPRLPRAARREPPLERAAGDGRGPPPRARRGGRGRPGARGAAAEPRLQRQVARAGLTPR